MKPPRFEFEPSPDLIPAIIAAVATHHDLTPKHILRHDRNGRLIWPRHLCMWLAVKLSADEKGGTRKAIASAFGRDDGTIHYALKSVQNAIDVYPKAKAEAEYWLTHFASQSAAAPAPEP